MSGRARPRDLDISEIPKLKTRQQLYNYDNNKKRFVFFAKVLGIATKELERDDRVAIKIVIGDTAAYANLSAKNLGKRAVDRELVAQCDYALFVNFTLFNRGQHLQFFPYWEHSLVLLRLLTDNNKQSIEILGDESRWEMDRVLRLFKNELPKEETVRHLYNITKCGLPPQGVNVAVVLQLTNSFEQTDEGVYVVSAVDYLNDCNGRGEGIVLEVTFFPEYAHHMLPEFKTGDVLIFESVRLLLRSQAGGVAARVRGPVRLASAAELADIHEAIVQSQDAVAQLRPTDPLPETQEF